MAYTKLVGVESAIGGIRLMNREVREEVAAVTKRSLKAVRQHAFHHAPVSNEEKKDGEKHLNRTIRAKVAKGSLHGVVTAGGKGARHANLVEGGTKAHAITSKKGKVLTDGKRVFGKAVKHPGMKAQPFMGPALASEADNYKRGVAQAVKKKVVNA